MIAVEVHAPTAESVEKFDAKVFTNLGTHLDFNQNWFYYDNGNTPPSVLRRDITGIDIPLSLIPVQTELYQNYPNTVNPTTKIKFHIGKAGHVQIQVFDILGRRVAVLANEFKNPGFYETTFNGNDLASGTYVLLLHTENFTKSVKMLLVK